LLYASACSRPTAGLLEAAVASSNFAGQLSKAADAGVVETDGDDVRFTHPLYGSAIYAEVSRDHRHQVHRRLAEVAEDPEERARHLALAAEGPDSGAAKALEDAARAAVARGSPIAAAELCEMAERLTPPERASDVLRLRIATADYWLLAGAYDRALQFIEPVPSSAPPGPERAEALLHLGRVLFFLDNHQRAAAVLGDALSEKGVPPATLSSIHTWRSWALNWAGDLLAAESHAEEALGLAELGDDPTALVGALTALATIRTALGRDITPDLMERALELEGSIHSFSVTYRPALVQANQFVWSGELDEARRICAALLEQATTQGDEDSVGTLHRALGQVELLAGNWEASRDHYEKGIALGPNLGIWRGTTAIVAACVGDVESARTEASEAHDAARGGHSVVGELLALSVLGFLELSLGNAAAANEYLRQAWRLHHRLGFGEPAMFRFVGDYTEVLIELGEHVEAIEVIDWLDERGQALDRPWALAVSARYRGLVAAADGDFQTAFASLDRALKEHERLPMPFELGRTMLVLGTIRRRAKQKRPAREALEEALAIFERLGAPLWADKARAELARIGGRRSAAGQLTEAEARVAKLAAAGRTNREIADVLFMSVRTVEGHLSHAYAKLGVRSRTELALFFD
jgi:DNA-binding CsgD family transcriptional regulator